MNPELPGAEPVRPLIREIRGSGPIPAQRSTKLSNPPKIIRLPSNGIAPS